MPDQGIFAQRQQGSQIAGHGPAQPCGFRVDVREEQLKMSPLGYAATIEMVRQGTRSQVDGQRDLRLSALAYIAEVPKMRDESPLCARNLIPQRFPGLTASSGQRDLPRQATVGRLRIP